MNLEVGFDCLSKAEGDEVEGTVDTVCEIQFKGTVGSTSQNMATIIMIAKFVLSLKIDPSTWLMVNSIQMV